MTPDLYILALLVRWVLVCAGILYLVTQAKIAMPVRGLVALVTRSSLWVRLGLYCPACVGFWLGLALGNTDFWPFAHSWWRCMLECGSATMALGSFLGLLWTGESYEIEAPFWGEEAQDDDEKTETQDG